MAEESRRQQAARRAETKALNQAEKEGSELGMEIVDNLIKRIELLNESGEVTEEILKKSEDLEKQFVSFTKKIPIVGDLLEKQLKEKIKETGGLQQIVYDKLIQSADGAKSFSQVLRNLVTRNPIAALIASVAALFAIIRKVRMAARDLASDFCQANILKYGSRYGSKDGRNKKDLMKVIHYAMLLAHFDGHYGEPSMPSGNFDQMP